MPALPHPAFPLRQAANGEIMEVEQDTIEDVRQCVHVLLRTPVGTRPLAPEVGVEDPTFSSSVDPAELQAALQDDEPRADITVTAAPVDATGRQDITIEVALAAEGEDDDYDDTEDEDEAHAL